MGRARGIAYVLLWYSSILGGYAVLFCPILPLIFFSNRLYRAVTDFLFTFWQMYPTALLRALFDCQITVTGDELRSDETALLVMNHRTRTDWNFLWPAVYHGTRGHERLRRPVKFVLKDEIRHIPGIGWVMQLACFLYIKRNWLVDKKRVTKVIDYFCDSGHKFLMLIFPEGTDLTPRTKAYSDTYADQHKLQRYEHVLHPRTTGFVYLANRLIEKDALDAVYDVTIAYCDKVPQTEAHILRGEMPEDIKIHFKRHPRSSLPNGETELKIFLEDLWMDKEEVLKQFQTSRRLPAGNCLNRDDHLELHLALIFWTLIPPIAIYLLLTIPIFRHLVAAHTIFLLAVNYFSTGFQNFEIALYDMKRRMRGSPPPP